MTVYVDDLVDYGNLVTGYARRYGTIRCHMSCGGDCDELHEMARRLGLRRSYAQHMDNPNHFFHHYDLVPSKREQALRFGAVYRSIWDTARQYHPRSGISPQ